MMRVQNMRTTVAVRLLLPLLLLGAPAACGGGKSGTATLPSGQAVSAAAKKPADHAALSTTISKTAAGACTQEDVGLCGCLPEEAYFSEAEQIYDMVCCAEVGDAFTMHSCGDETTCDESGTMVVCGMGAHGG